MISAGTAPIILPSVPLTLRGVLDAWRNITRGEVIVTFLFGSAVIVYLTIDSLKYPVALLVDKETLKISFSPVSKYPSP